MRSGVESARAQEAAGVPFKRLDLDTLAPEECEHGLPRAEWRCPICDRDRERDEMTAEIKTLRSMLTQWVDLTDKNAASNVAYNKARGNDAALIRLGQEAIECGYELDAWEESVLDLVKKWRAS